MGKTVSCLIACILVVLAASPLFAEDDMAKKMSDILMKAPDEEHWQVTSDEVLMWIKTGKTDFMVLDVRPDIEEYKAGHIPSAIHIPYYAVLDTENLKKLPKDKKLVLACATGQLENLPVAGLRMLGYEAYTLLFGYVSWIKEYGGGDAIKSIIDKAAAKNYPLEQTGGAK